MSDEKLILLGTHGDYIHSAIYNPISKSLRLGKSTKTEPHPSWLTRHPCVLAYPPLSTSLTNKNTSIDYDRFLPDIIYANQWAEGVVFALRLDGRTGNFSQADRKETGGKGLNHMAVLSDGSAIIGAHVRFS